MRRRLFGSAVGVLGALFVGLALLPLRSHLAESTASLILVVPVVLGAAVGGFVAGVASVGAGFLVYDFLYIPPYQTLTVGSTQNWVALVVYVIVMVLVARVVANLQDSRVAVERGGEAARRLSELSELLVGDQPVDHLLKTIVTATYAAFDVSGVALLVLDEGHLKVAASAGADLTDDELRRINPQSGEPVRVGTLTGTPGELRSIALSASGDAVGILTLRELPTSRIDSTVLRTFANDAALAIERAHLREQALQSALLEEADRFRQGLMSAVSHDLRTPLSTIKVASSTLVNRSETLDAAQAGELYRLIEVEADRLTRLVTNLLDMSRIEAGVLSVHGEVRSVWSLVHETLDSMSSAVGEDRIRVDIARDVPDVFVDPMLIVQVLVNLIDNALRHSPPGGEIVVSATREGDRVDVAVLDEGPGIAPALRASIFERFAQLDKGGRAGLGLTIAKTFVEAHGEAIWVDEAPGGGAKFVFSLPIATPGQR